MKFSPAARRPCGAFQRGLGQHPGLQRQQIAEDARQRHHHIDPRAAQLFQRDQIRAGRAARNCRSAALRPSAPSAWAIGPPSDLMLSVPQSTSATDSGAAGSSCRWRPAAALRLRAPSLHGKGRGHAERIKGVDVAAGGQDSGERIRSPPGHRADKAPSSARISAGSLVVSCSASVRSARARVIRSSVHVGRQRYSHRAPPHRPSSGRRPHAGRRGSARLRSPAASATASFGAPPPDRPPRPVPRSAPPARALPARHRRRQARASGSSAVLQLSKPLVEPRFAPAAASDA